MSATITISSPADLMQVLRAKVTASGQGVEAYALTVLQKDAGLPSLRDLFADMRGQIKRMEFLMKSWQAILTRRWQQ